ncbi:MAG: pentapeptide repeat-containing protein [Alphaproteobacteria bacterium]|nr:pentapeptide repeat-containing protein [Alphaproteobacteria bacterium]
MTDPRGTSAQQPAKPILGGLRSLIGHVSLKVRARKERRDLHPIALDESDVAVLEMLTRGAYVDANNATLRIVPVIGSNAGATAPHLFDATKLAEFVRLKFVKVNGAGFHVITDRGRAAARVAKDPRSALRAGGGDVAEFVRRELELRLAAHEKWLARGMGGKQLIARYVDFSGISLAGRNLSQIALEGCILHGADLKGATLRGSKLHGCDLSLADLRKADARACDLRGCDLSQARLDGADFSDVNLGPAKPETIEGLRLAHARHEKTFSEQVSQPSGRDGDQSGILAARLDGARLVGTVLRGAILDRTSARNADFSGADLRDARLEHADCAYADFAGAKVAGVRWQGAMMGLACAPSGGMPPGTAARRLPKPDPVWLKDALTAHLSFLDRGQGVRASFAGLDLSEADFADARLNGADFRDANLESANFARSSLVCADLRGANLSRANLSAADLRGVQLAGAETRGVNLKDARSPFALESGS